MSTLKYSVPIWKGVRTGHHPSTSITTKSKPLVRLGRWLSELADNQYKIEHKKGSENIWADTLSRLNLPNGDEGDMAYVEKIINAMGLEFDPAMEILEFSEMMGVMGRVGEEKEPEPVELNSFEFFVQALSYFEGKHAENSVQANRAQLPRWKV